MTSTEVISSNRDWFKAKVTVASGEIIEVEASNISALIERVNAWVKNIVNSEE